MTSTSTTPAVEQTPEQDLLRSISRMRRRCEERLAMARRRREQVEAMAAAAAAQTPAPAP